LRRDILKAGAWRPNELIVEHDEGSPWATLSPERTRMALSAHTKLTAAEASAHESRLVFSVTSDRHLGHTIGGLRAEATVLLRRGIERVDFSLEAEWNCYNHRVRIAMPLAFRGRGVYGIPYGAIERRSYEPTFGWTGANGDWPAVNWAGVSGRGVSVALLNRGTPSYLHEKGAGGDVLMLSVLRSPAVPTYLHEPLSYEMKGFDGMRDAGHHRFEYALTACGGAFADSDVANVAESYNGGPLAVEGLVALPGTPVVESRNVRLAAVKWAEKGRARVVRLVEYRGRRGEARVRVPAGVARVAKTNLLERDGRDVPIADGCATLVLRPWEIATLRLEL
jgi:alpha-mannosidase